MDKNEFQKKYHYYTEQDKHKAQQEADKVNEVADGFSVMVAGPMLGKYCLMVDTAANFLKAINIP